MSLPVFLTTTSFAQANEGDVFTVGVEVAHHAVRVRRMGVGEKLDIIDGAGSRARGTIVQASPDSLSVKIAKLSVEPQATPRLVLVQALAKGERDLQAIEAATEVGVDAVIPWAATRSVVDWPAKKAAKMADKWRNVLTAATLQSRRARVPELREMVRGNRLASLCKDNTQMIVLHEAATVSVPAVLTNLRQGHGNTDVSELLVVVGPEGGITDAEVAAAQAAGAHIAVLGPTVLRASTAGPVALGIVQTLLGRWT